MLCSEQPFEPRNLPITLHFLKGIDSPVEPIPIQLKRLSLGNTNFILEEKKLGVLPELSSCLPVQTYASLHGIFALKRGELKGR